MLDLKKSPQKSEEVSQTCELLLSTLTHAHAPTLASHMAVRIWSWCSFQPYCPRRVESHGTARRSTGETRACSGTRVRARLSVFGAWEGRFEEFSGPSYPCWYFMVFPLEWVERSLCAAHPSSSVTSDQ